MKKIIISIMLFNLTACAMFNPYEETFGCRNKDKMGKCISPAQAYKEALSGREIYPHMTQDLEDGDEKKLAASTATASTSGTTSSYQELEYRELHSLINKPKIPLVSKPKVLRTLILSYSTGADKDAKLYMPRFVYSFLDQGKFNLGRGGIAPQEVLNTPLFMK